MSQPTTAELDSKSRVSQTDVTERFTLPRRVKPIQENKSVLKLTQYPLLRKQEELLGLSFVYDGEDINWDTLDKMAKPDTRTSKVTTIVRQQGIDHLNLYGKGKVRQEFLVWYSLEEGRLKRGQRLPSAYIAHGLDYNHTVFEKYDEDDNPLKPEIGVKFPIYTIKWSKQELDKALDVNNSETNVQFVVNASRSYGGYVYEEIANLELTELIERARLGRTGSDTSVLFSSLSTKDKLFLQGQKPK